MDTQIFQNLGESPAPSNDFQAGEFAKLPDVSPVALHPAATIGSLVRITKDYRTQQVGQFGIVTDFHKAVSELYQYYDVAFGAGHDEYLAADFEILFPFPAPFYDLQSCLIQHLNTLLALPVVESQHEQALLFITSKLHDVILFDADGFKRELETQQFNACQLLRFAHEDLTNAFKFGRRVSDVFKDAAFEKLRKSAVILKADSVAVVSS